ncbi:MAG: hydrolase [Bacillota bacterium]|nr:hydrolase [Bacillota bacterium]
MDVTIELTIQRDKALQFPVVAEGITLTTDRKGSPGQLKFKVIRDSALDIQHGDPVRLKVNGKNIFFGIVFTMKTDKNQLVEITAYDQLRYLKNKDTIVYENKTASELLGMIASDFRLNTGVVEDTGFKIKSRVEDNKSLFDMIQYALDATLKSKGKLYVLYDDFGKLTLKSLKSMRTGVVIDEESGENFSYTSTIDRQTYNKIKLVQENKDTGKREVYIAQHGENMNRWGVLQLYDTLKDGENGKQKADSLLKLHNSPVRDLSIQNAIGNLSVRAGSLVIVMLSLGDTKIGNMMLVEKCRHDFRGNEHFMSLTLRGGEFLAG